MDVKIQIPWLHPGALSQDVWGGAEDLTLEPQQLSGSEVSV